jgi:hypothetical protein
MRMGKIPAASPNRKNGLRNERFISEIKFLNPNIEIRNKIFEISPHPLPLPSGERGRVRGIKC